MNSGVLSVSPCIENTILPINHARSDRWHSLHEAQMRTTSARKQLLLLFYTLVNYGISSSYLIYHNHARISFDGDRGSLRPH